ncbi:MAG: GNAT family N-acetyltransferase [Limimaricola sp.]|uniref:GNAT family N-acetyltransferase n=1 Tax=Limimaricola sp. TaxID=2211665 RepID=UPI001D8D1A93|nr:GNAT family N-acetyltransferase [Limimaricola sp.]MBI1418361.1 GNAT family N-acetyltransferase [Limimaricola sp.]
MSTAITLAGTADRDRVLGLMAQFHAERGLAHDDVHRARAADPLLEGSPLGAVWLIGPGRAPLGYVLVGFGWSVTRAGMEGWVNEVYIRPSVRRRGIGTEVLHAVAVALSQAGLTALHVRVDHADEAAQRFCARVGFAARPEMLVMTDTL